MKGNLMVRLMTAIILIAITLAHLAGQTNLFSANWLWLAILPAFTGLQATFTGWCPAELIGTLSKTGECCPGGSCSSQAKPVKESSCCSKAEKNSCCDSQPEEKTTRCCDNAFEIKVLGTGCATCVNTVKLIETTAEELGVSITVTKVEEVSDIAAYGVMSTPGIVIHDQVVHSGSMPNKKMIAQWLSA